MKNILFLGFFAYLYSTAFSQINLQDSVVKAGIIQVELGVGLPAGDVANRFGIHELVGAGYQYKTKQNLLVGFHASYIFGTGVKDTSISNLFNSSNAIIGTDGYYFSPVLYEQAFNFQVEAGKITNLLGVNPNSGIAFLAGAGYLQHNILIYVDEIYVPQLNKEYRKGYDRFSNGFALSQYIGYYFFSNKHFVNFRAGFEFTEAFTKNRRYNFDVQSIDDTNNFDMFITFKATWNLPVFREKQRTFYY